MKNFLKFWLPLYIYAALIFSISSISKPLPETDIPSLDKVLHIGAYALLGILASRAFRNSPRDVIFKNFKLLAVLGTSLYGISDELHQLFVPGREFSIFDIVADTIGGIVGTFVYSKYY